MREKGFVLPLVLAIVVIVLVAVGVIAYFQLKPKLSPQPEVSQPTPSSTTASTATPLPTDEIADWKTYSNEKADFSFKYPNDLYSFKEICGDLEHPNYEVTLYTQKLSCQEFENYPFSKPSTQSIFAIYVSDDKFNLQEEFEKGAAKDIDVKTEYIDFNSIPAVRASTTLFGGTSIVVTFNHADYGFQIIYTESDAQKYQLNKVLSTFQFIA